MDTHTKELDFSEIALYQKRRFVPEQADLTDTDVLKSLYSKLLDRAVSNTADFEAWIIDRSELEAALDQQGAVLYIRMTCQTDDAKRAEEYKTFIEKVLPMVKPFDDRLNKKFMEYTQKFHFKNGRYDIYVKEIRSDIELFVEKNIELETQVDLLSQEYQSICGAMTVEFEGEERTLPQMGKYLLETDRDLRERAWRASAQRRLKEKDRLDRLFDKMLKLRHKIGINANFDNYCDYQFKANHRFDYTPQDCFEYHASIKRCVVPLWTKILEQRKLDMGGEDLRPWDTAVDPKGRKPLKPFEKVEELVDGCKKVFKRVDEQLGSQFVEMADAQLLDLASRKGKAPGGYQSTLDESRKPFIFMNAVGVDGDVRTLLHEGGHAFHAMACAHEPLLDYRHGPMEFNEVASMGMELLADKYLDIFYNAEDQNRSCRNHLEDVIFTLVWVATIDAFQHWIYRNPKHNTDERRDQWLKLRAEFSGVVVNWSGLEEEHAYLWHRQLHIFEYPFYYIEYGIAQLGALQLWLNYKADPQKAIKDYRSALALGGSRPLPELFRTAGLKFDFSEKTINPLVDAVRKELESLEH